MTKNQVLVIFREMYPAKEFRKNNRKYTDKVAKREAWNNYVDRLQKDGQVTQRQADTWDNPF